MNFCRHAAVMSKSTRTNFIPKELSSCQQNICLWKNPTLIFDIKDRLDEYLIISTNDIAEGMTILNANLDIHLASSFDWFHQG